MYSQHRHSAILDVHACPPLYYVELTLSFGVTTKDIPIRELIILCFKERRKNSIKKFTEMPNQIFTVAFKFSNIFHSNSLPPNPVSLSYTRLPYDANLVQRSQNTGA